MQSFFQKRCPGDCMMRRISWCTWVVLRKNTAHRSTIHVTMGLPPRHMINPRPTRVVSGKAIGYRGRPRRYDVDPSSGWREVDEHKNSLSRISSTGSIIHVYLLISTLRLYCIRGQSGTWYNSREKSSRYRNIRRRLSLCCCSVHVYLLEQICS